MCWDAKLGHSKLRAKRQTLLVRGHCLKLLGSQLTMLHPFGGLVILPSESAEYIGQFLLLSERLLAASCNRGGNYAAEDRDVPFSLSDNCI